MTDDMILAIWSKLIKLHMHKYVGMNAYLNKLVLYINNEYIPIVMT